MDEQPKTIKIPVPLKVKQGLTLIVIVFGMYMTIQIGTAFTNRATFQGAAQQICLDHNGTVSSNQTYNVPNISVIQHNVTYAKEHVVCQVQDQRIAYPFCEKVENAVLSLNTSKDFCGI